MTAEIAPWTGSPQLLRRLRDVMALIGIGIRELSMSPANIGPVKAMILSLDAASMSNYLNTLLASPAPSIRSHLKSFALDHGITV